MYAVEHALSSGDEAAASYRAHLRLCSAELGRLQVQGVNRRLRRLLRAPTHGLWGQITLAVHFTTVMTVPSFHSLITWLLAREPGGPLLICCTAKCTPTQHLFPEKFGVKSSNKYRRHIHHDTSS